jgi:hypothetical protein
MGMSADKPMKDGTASRVLGLLWGRKANRDDGKRMIAPPSFLIITEECEKQNRKILPNDRKNPPFACKTTRIVVQ